MNMNEHEQTWTTMEKQYLNGEADMCDEHREMGMRFEG